MKKFISLSLSIALISISAVSQFSVTFSIPSAGDSFPISFDSSTEVDIGESSGSAQSWDFTNLIPQADPFYFSYDDTAVSLSNPDFKADCNVRRMIFRPGFGQIEEFLSNDNNKGAVVGFHFFGNQMAPAQNVLLTSPDTTMKSDLTLGSSFEDQTGFKLGLSANLDEDSATRDTFVRITHSLYENDAFGTVETAFGTYTVVRQKQTKINYDSIYSTDTLSSLTTVMPAPMNDGSDTTINYLYLSSDFAHPIATVFTNTVEGITGTSFISGAFADFAIIPGIANVGDTVLFFENAGGYPDTYYWDFGDSKGYSTAKDTSYVYEQDGEYTVNLTVENAYGINTKSYILTVNGPSGVSELKENAKLEIYPNPAFTNFYFNVSEYDGTVALIDVYDAQGRLIKQIHEDANSGEVYVAGWSSGLFIIKMYDDKGNLIASSRVIKS